MSPSIKILTFSSSGTNSYVFVGFILIVVTFIYSV